MSSPLDYPHTPITIAGAGLAGATIARELADYGFQRIDVFEERTHVAGNAHTFRDPKTKVMVHAYGPHIFHTENRLIWDFVNRFTRMLPYIQRTKAVTGGRVYSFPINLHTINQFYAANFTPEQAREHIAAQVDWDHEQSPANFEEMALSTIGRDLYEAFLRDYTIKQWGMLPTKIPCSVLARLPLRFNYNDNAYDHEYQGMPDKGYTVMVERMLNHPAIRTHLGQKAPLQPSGFLFYTGAIDEYYGYVFGKLPYRTIDFKFSTHHGTSDQQGCAVLNYCDDVHAMTRSTEHGHFEPWNVRTGSTIVSREYSREWTEDDIRYYPMRFDEDKARFDLYQRTAAQEERVIFAGRLGTYRYLDMDKVILDSLDRVQDFLLRSS